MTSTPTFADETEIRQLYATMLDSWEQGAEAYAECFAPDATYIIANGMVQRGWQEIVEGHRIIFTAWARNSRLEGRIDSIRFLTADVAQLVAYGRVVYTDTAPASRTNARCTRSRPAATRRVGASSPTRTPRSALTENQPAQCRRLARCRER